MLNENRLNSIFFVASLVILSLLWFNVSHNSSSVLGSVPLLIFIILVGSWMGRLLFSYDNKISQQLFGVMLVICWIVVTEGILVIVKRFTSELLFLPLIILPVVLLVFGAVINRKPHMKVDEKRVASFEESYNSRDFFPIILFLIGFFGSLFSASYVRNDLMLFSIWEVMPTYFWIFMFITLISFVFLQIRISNKHHAFEVSLLCSFLIAFLYFCLMVLVVKVSFDPDVWNNLAFVRVVFDFGGRAINGGLVIQYSGYHGFLATFAKSMGNTFDTPSVQGITWLWSPLMASIFVPFITYRFLRLFHPEGRDTHVFFLGVVAFLLFPSFWLMSVSVPEMVGDVFMYANLFFITIFLSDERPHRGLFLVVLTTLATYLIHPISGTFALMADLGAISFHGKIWKMRKLRYVFFLSAAILALLLFPLEFTWVQSFVNTSGVLHLSNISIEKGANFWFSPVWLPSLYTSQSLMSENFNWARYVLFAAGLLALRPIIGNGKRRMKAWLVSIIVLFWIGWFVTVNGIGDLPYGTQRFARDVDLALLPLASLAIYEASSRLMNVIRK